MSGFTKRRPVFACLVAVAVALGLIAGVGARRANAQLASYSITDLGSLGGAQSKARAINNSGRVVGESTLAGGPNSFPFEWSGATMINIESFVAGAGSGGAQAINEFGYAVGFAETSTGTVRPFIWSDIFGKKDLGTLGGELAVALDINDSVQVVGQSEIRALVDRGFVWSPTTGMQTIPTLGGSSSTANGINNAGQIVGGSSTASGQYHAFLLSGGVMNDMGTLGGSQSIAYEINDAGEAVGYSTTVTGPINPPLHAFVYTVAGGMTDLGTLGGSRSIAYDINAHGDIVGSSEISPGVERAFVYSPLTGMLDLNTLIAPGWTLVEAHGVNDKGQIVGTGINPQGQTHAFLLTSLRDEIPGSGPPPCFSASSPILLPAQPAIAPPLNNKSPMRRSFTQELPGLTPKAAPASPSKSVPLPHAPDGANRVTRNQKLLIRRDDVDRQP